MMVQEVPDESVQVVVEMYEKGSRATKFCHSSMPSRPGARPTYVNQERYWKTALARAASGPRTELRHAAAENFVKAPAPF